MRPTKILFALLALPTALAAQQHRHGGVLVIPQPAPRPTVTVTQPGIPVQGGGCCDEFGRPVYVRPPRISLDSAVYLMEQRYQGWFVDSKSFTRDRGRPIYVLRMITGGMTGTRELWVDGDNGDPLNPEVMGDTTTVRRRPRYPTAPTYP